MFANFEEAGKGLVASGKALDKVEVPEHLKVPLQSHLAAIEEIMRNLPAKLVPSQSPAEANKQAFEGSAGYKTACETAKLHFNMDTLPQSLYDSLWKAFKKPYADTDTVPAQEWVLTAEVTLKDKNKRQAGRPASGETPVNPDRKLKDNASTDDKARVYYTTLWDAYKRDGEHKDLMTAEELKGQYYALGGHGSKFAKRLAELGKIKADEVRGFLRSYEKAQNALWEKAGNGLRFEEVTD